LAALAQESRLDTFRLLIQAGPAGTPAGEVATALGVSPNTLTFHFDRLHEAGLVTVRREGRSMIYAAQFDAMNTLFGYLTENCCAGQASCGPTSICQPARKRTRVQFRGPPMQYLGALTNQKMAPTLSCFWTRGRDG
jgi:DNA-binding transcriptional ArsR family regulator